MDRRRKILDNKYEEATEKALQRSTAKQDARTFVKVRIADALNIDGSGLTNEEFSYALKAHFDFVVTDKGSQSLFVVEFDGSQHQYEPHTLQRDRLKNSICDKLGMPLLRIDKAYLKRVERFASILDWLIEMWFMEQAWNEAYDKGDLPQDADFYPFSIFEWGYMDKDSFVPVDRKRISPDELASLVRNGYQLTWRSYDPFAPYFNTIRKLHEAGVCLDAFPITVEHIDWDTGYSSVMAYVHLLNQTYIVGTVKCRVSNFITGGIEIAQNLAIVDCAYKLLKHKNGVDIDIAIPSHELDKLKQSIGPKVDG